MAEQKTKGVPFAISLNTRPPQYGLIDFTVTRFILGVNAELMEPADITASVAIDEFTTTVLGYIQAPTVRVQGFAKADRIGVSDPGKEISVGDIIDVGTGVYAVTSVDLDAAGDGTVDLALPLRADVPANTVITRSGRTGHYRITVTENMVGSVQYLVHADASYPVIEVSSQVLDIVVGDGGVLVDNSKLLL